MAFYLTNGSLFVKYGPGGQYEAVRMKSRAQTFDDRLEAEAALAVLPKNMKKMRFFVVETESSVQPVPVQEQKPPEVVSVPVAATPPAAPVLSSFSLEAIKEVVLQFENLAIQLKQNREKLLEEQHRAEAQIFDLEHAAEFGTLDAWRGYLLYKKLHEARVTRRKCKDALFVLEYFDDVLGSGLYRRDLSRRIGGLQNREFTPRTVPNIMDDLHIKR